MPTSYQAVSIAGTDTFDASVYVILDLGDGSYQLLGSASTAAAGLGGLFPGVGAGQFTFSMLSGRSDLHVNQSDDGTGSDAGAIMVVNALGSSAGSSMAGFGVWASSQFEMATVTGSDLSDSRLHSVLDLGGGNYTLLGSTLPATSGFGGFFPGVGSGQFTATTLVARSDLFHLNEFDDHTGSDAGAIVEVNDIGSGASVSPTFFGMDETGNGETLTINGVDTADPALYFVLDLGGGNYRMLGSTLVASTGFGGLFAGVSAGQFAFTTTLTQANYHLNQFDDGTGSDPGAIVVVNASGSTAAVGVTNFFADIVASNVDGTSGNDFVHRAGDGNASPSGYTNVEGVTTGPDTINGGEGDDLIYGDTGIDRILGQDGNDVLYGGDDNDVLVAGAGVDQVFGDGGDDRIVFAHRLNSSDMADGGSGFDRLILAGHYGHGIVGSGVTGIEKIALHDGASGSLTLNDANCAAGETLVASAVSLGAGNAVTFDGSGESDGFLALKGGAGNDHLTGGALADRLQGGDGDDTLAGGGGSDVFLGGTGADTCVYSAPSESNDAATDAIGDFDASADTFDLWFTVSGIDAAVTAHTLRWLGNALDAAHLGASHAALATLDNGHIYLAIDANGSAGYQAGADLLIRMDGMTGTLSAGNFG